MKLSLNFSALLLIGLASVSHATLRQYDTCLLNDQQVGDYCGSGLACIRDTEGNGECLPYTCNATGAPLTIRTATPTTITVATSTSTAYQTAWSSVNCRCGPYTYFTTSTTVTGPQPTNTATVGPGHPCTGSSVCKPGLECVPFVSSSLCESVTCINPTLPASARTITPTSVVGETTVTRTSTVIQLTLTEGHPYYCNTCYGAPTETTITFTITATPAPTS